MAEYDKYISVATFGCSGICTHTTPAISQETATDLADPYAAQQLLSHSSIDMTEAYIKQRQTDVVQPLRRKE